MLVEIKGVTKTYQSGDAQVNALDNASLNIEEGDFTVLVGRLGWWWIVIISSCF